MKPEEFMEYFANHPLDMDKVLKIVDRHYDIEVGSLSDLKDFLFTRRGQYPVVILGDIWNSNCDEARANDPLYLAYSQVQSPTIIMEYFISKPIMWTRPIIHPIPAFYTNDKGVGNSNVIHSPYEGRFKYLANRDFIVDWDGWNTISAHHTESQLKTEFQTDLNCLEIEFKRLYFTDFEDEIGYEEVFENPFAGATTLREYFEDVGVRQRFRESDEELFWAREPRQLVLVYRGELDSPTLNFPRGRGG